MKYKIELIADFGNYDEIGEIECDDELEIGEIGSFNCGKYVFPFKVLSKEGNCKVGIIGNYDIVVLAEKEIEKNN